MALIAELSKFDVAFLPIGDFYTMGPERAAKAVQLLGVKTVVPMHFATFPILTGRPSQLQELLGPGVRVLDVKPGDTVQAAFGPLPSKLPAGKLRHTSTVHRPACSR